MYFWVYKMWSDRNSFLDTLSDSETMSKPSTYSDSEVHNMLKVNISKTNKLIEPKRSTQTRISIDAKPTSEVVKRQSGFKNCSVSNVLQTLKKFDQKYSYKNTKEQTVTSSYGDKNNELSSEMKPGRRKNSLSNLEPNSKESKQKKSTYSSEQFSPNNSTSVSIDISQQLTNDKSGMGFSISEYKNHSADYPTKSLLNKIRTSSQVKRCSKSETDFTQYELDHSIPIVHTENCVMTHSLDSEKLDSDSHTLYSSSKFKIKPEILSKLQISENPLNGGEKSPVFNKAFLQKTQYSKTPQGSVGTKDQNVSDESKFKVKYSSSDNSIQEEISFKSCESEKNNTNNLVLNIITNVHQVPSFNTNPSQDVDFVQNNLTKKNLIINRNNDKVLSKLNSKIIQQPKEISVSNSEREGSVLMENQEETENSITFDLSDISVSSAVESLNSPGLFKSGPYKIFAIEDLPDADEMQKKEESLHMPSDMEESKRSKTISSCEDSVKNDSMKVSCLKSDQSTLLESEEEINDIIEEEFESQCNDILSESSNNSTSIKTNSSYGEMMNQIQSNSASEDNEYHTVLKKENISNTQLCNESVSVQTDPNTSKPEVSNKEDIISEHKIPPALKSTEDGSNLNVSTKLNILIDSQALPVPTPTSIGTSMKPLRNTTYSSIGVQTDINTVTHNSLLYSENRVQQLNFSEPLTNSHSKHSHSHLDSVPVYGFFSRLMTFQGTVTPADLAFSEILKHQIELTKHFISSQERMYQAYCTSIENISANYKPITLENTRQYIRSLRKSRSSSRDDLHE